MNFHIKNYNKSVIDVYLNFILLIFIFIIISNDCIFADETETNKLKKLIFKDSEQNDFSGTSVAISNDYAVVSVYGDNANEDDDNYLRKNGSVYIYKLIGSDWVQIKNLFPNTPRTSDSFGASVSIDGEYVVVGAPSEDVIPKFYNKIDRAGAIYIYKKDYGGIDNWGEVKKIITNDRISYKYFGNSVAINDDNIIVGAFKESFRDEENFLNESGSAYIYEKDFGGLDNWGEIKKLIASDKNISDFFGYSVAINKDYAIVGSPTNDIETDNSSYDAGAAYIYHRDFDGINNWGEVKKIIPSNPGGDNFFGYSVAINNNYVVIGSPSYESIFINQIGKNTYSSAYIFEKNIGGENNWGEIKQLIPQSFNLFNGFGSSVSVSDDCIVIGSPEEKYDDLGHNKYEDAGAVFIYYKNYGGINNWGQFKKYVPYFRNLEDKFGYSVAISGDNLIIGAPYVDELSTKYDLIQNTGAVYTFKLNAFDSIYNINNNQNIHVYPNPSTNLLNIELNETKEYKTFSVYNTLGIEILTFPISSKHITLNTLELSNGIYYLYISNDLNEYIIQIFIVNK